MKSLNREDDVLILVKGSRFYFEEFFVLSIWFDIFGKSSLSFLHLNIFGSCSSALFSIEIKKLVNPSKILVNNIDVM